MVKGVESEGVVFLGNTVGRVCCSVTWQAEYREIHLESRFGPGVIRAFLGKLSLTGISDTLGVPAVH